uniref:hypothetical protein n=1 Tax=Castellaniella defragrans TaxID=75697 RepID=UPI003341C3B3
MAAIQTKPATAYYAPTKGRRYLTARAAAYGEAAAQLENKHPSEATEYDDFGRITYPGYSWREDERFVRVRQRYARLLLRALHKEQPNDN